MTQGELFDQPKPKPSATALDAKDGRKLMRTLRSSAKGGLVNGMTKAQLRRYATPARLPRVTI